MTNTVDDGDEKVALKDKIGVIQVGASIVLAIIGFAFTWVQFDATERRSLIERQSKEFESFLTLYQRCASDDQNERARIRRVLFEYKTNPKLGRNPTLEEVMASCTNLINERDAGPGTSGGKTAQLPTQPTSSESSKPTTKPETWVYLGTYSKEKWETRYLNFLETDGPSAFAGKTYTVRYATGALNVRTGPFSPTTGAFPPVTSSLSPGDKVKVLSTWPWFNSDNWWARVEIL